MNWLIIIFFILVIFILYLLRRYVRRVEGFEDGANIFNKVTMCPVLAKHIGINSDTQDGLAEEKAVSTLKLQNDLTKAYQKKYDELGCAKVKAPPK